MAAAWTTGRQSWHAIATARRWLAGIVFGWIFYATTALLVAALLPLPLWPANVLSPFRFANQYGLFGIMTRGQYQIEFQGSYNGKTWIAYPFLYKPQNPAKAPGIYAPYQPRFDWNLWFASQEPWREAPMVLRTEVLLLRNDPAVLSLFAGNPFAAKPPLEVRAVLWQYWFTDPAGRRATGDWWRRKLVGLYAPALVREPDGRPAVVEMPRAGVMGH